MPTPSLLSLGADLAHEQDRILGDQRIHEVDLLRSKRRSTQHVRSRTRHTFLLLFGLFVVATTTYATIALRFPTVRYSIDGTSAGTGSNVFGHWLTTSANEPSVLRFTDGSTAKPARGSRARVVGTSRRGASIILESGSLELQVAGGRHTEYLVGAGPFALAVTRGRVEVSWDSMNASLDLIVHQGMLAISGCQFAAGARVTSSLVGVRCNAQ